jgi:hypothetical protein
MTDRAGLGLSLGWGRFCQRVGNRTDIAGAIEIVLDSGAELRSISPS